MVCTLGLHEKKGASHFKHFVVFCVEIAFPYFAKWKEDGLLMNRGRVRNPGNVSGRWGDGGNPEISDSETSGLFLHIIKIADHMPCFQ